MHKLRTLHLFTGAGGGILADILLGHQPVCAVEIDAYCQQVLSARQKDGILPWFPIFGDIKKFDGRPWRGLVDIIAGGFPCQNISPSGDRTGLDGEKSGLWSEMARVVREVEPAYVFVENSAALTIRGLGRVLGDLAQMGFNAEWGMFGATDAIWLDGTPAFDHERFRIFIKATHPNRVRKLQPERRIENQRRWTGNGNEKIANSSFQRHCIKKTTNTNSSHKDRDDGGFERYGKTTSITTSVGGWWSAEPTVGRVVHGLANRDDRIKCLGNGQVPAVAALAWSILK